MKTNVVVILKSVFFALLRKLFRLFRINGHDMNKGFS
jgi:hypothetical protein